MYIHARILQSTECYDIIVLIIVIIVVKSGIIPEKTSASSAASTVGNYGNGCRPRIKISQEQSHQQQQA